MKLIHPQETVRIIQENEFHFQKRFGQNFLIDENILKKIIDCSHITNEDFVLEIGPGIGTLTESLCNTASFVSCVEIDSKLIPILQNTLKDYSNVEIIQHDFLKLNIREFINNRSSGRPVKVVANLPYYITTPIIMSLLESKVKLTSVTIMVQQEVAQRICALPGSKDYGSLSLFIQYYTSPKIIASVPPTCFIPRPSVSSSILYLDFLSNPPVDVKNPDKLFSIIRASFSQRRKTLANALSANLRIPKNDILTTLQGLSLQKEIRGEDLSLYEFAVISDRLPDF